MLNRIFVNNCLDLDNFDMSFDSTHSVVNKDKNKVIKILRNIYNGSEKNDILDTSKESEIKLYFILNNEQIDYISSYLVLDSNYLVVYKLINNDNTKYFINEKEVSFQTIKRVLNYLIDNLRIVYNLYNDPLTVLDNYISKRDENYSMNKYNYLKLISLRKEYENELNIINQSKSDDSINDLINIKNEIEAFDLEKGEISYISKKYEELNKEDSNKANISDINETFNKALLLMKDKMPLLSELENNEKIKDEVVSLEEAFFTLKTSLDNFNSNITKAKDENDEYIIERYNNIKKFQEKYGNTYKEINEYYQSVISKLNYYKYSKMNLDNIKDKIDTLDKQSKKLNSNLNHFKQNYVLNIINYFNELCSHFDENITLSTHFDEENEDEISLLININGKSVTLEELKEYDNYNLITFLLNTIFLSDEDKTIIVDDDFSDSFNKDQIYIFIKLLNQFNNCLILSSNEYLG